jgi:hypothetical protein
LHHPYQIIRGEDVVPVLKQKPIQFANCQEQDGSLQSTAHLHARNSAGCISRTHVANSAIHGIWKGIVLETNFFKHQRNNVS